MSYWEAYIELPEKLTLECGHKHRTYAAAKKCAVKLKGKYAEWESYNIRKIKTERK